MSGLLTFNLNLFLIISLVETMISELSVENFKCLKQISIKLKPLTVFIGPNGSGKSSILQSILILKRLFVTQGAGISIQGLFHIDKYIDMGTWEDVVFDNSKPIKIALKVVENDAQMLLDTTFSRDSKVSLDVKILIGGIENTFSKIIVLPYQPKQSQSVSIRFKEGSLSGSWDGFNLTITSVAGRVSDEVKNAIMSLLNSWHRKVFFIPASTSMFRMPQVNIGWQSKSDILDAIKSSSIADEAHLIALLATDPDTEDYVLKCVKKLFGIEVRGRPLPTNVARIISSIRKGKTIPIVNEGGGINRCIYTFTILALADAESTIMIEEPETNLHPKAQYDLAGTFTEAVTKERKQIIITTHSEHLLFGILQQIRKKEVKREEIAIYYVQKDAKDGKTVVEELEIDEHGRVKGGLPGFFEEEVRELVGLLGE